MNPGKKIRLRRIINPRTEKTVIVPMDHGVTVGPLEGLRDMNKAISEVRAGGADAVIAHKGLAGLYADQFGRDLSLIIHLSASENLGTFPIRKFLVGSVEEAIGLGADAVSIHVNIGDRFDGEMLADFGAVSGECERLGMPLLAMMYPRGVNVPDEKNVEVVAQAARIGAELGADIVKTNFTGEVESFRQVIEGCPVPVVIAGGEKGGDRETLQAIEDSMAAGGAGVSIGRNVFQHPDPRKMTEAVCAVVHQGKAALAVSDELRRD